LFEIAKRPFFVIFNAVVHFRKGKPWGTGGHKATGPAKRTAGLPKKQLLSRFPRSTKSLFLQYETGFFILRGERRLNSFFA
jgi:hypothetical protein